LSVDPKAEVTRAIYSYAQDDPLADGDPNGEWYEPLGEEEQKYMQYFTWIDNKVRASLLARHEHSRLNEFTVLAIYTWSKDLYEISRESNHLANSTEFQHESQMELSESYNGTLSCISSRRLLIRLSSRN
jgi:hypothetical protein